MAHARETVTIDRPVEVVFEFVLNGMNNPLWQPLVMDVQRLADTPGGPSFKQGLRGSAGGRIEGEYTVVETQTNQLIGFELTAGTARRTGRITFEAIGSQTRVGFALEAQTRGLARLVDPLLGRALQNEVSALHNLKGFLEGQQHVLYEHRFG